jgi:hypothetical protein
LDIKAIDKPHDTWCKHCRPGKGGCAIYNERPVICRAYACVWLMGANIPEAWRPDKCKLIFDTTGTMDEQPAYTIYVDAAVPNRWQEEPYYRAIKSIALNGLQGYHETHWMTRVIVNDKVTLVLPNKDVAIADDESFLVMQTGSQSWEVIKCNNPEHLHKVKTQMIETAEIFRRLDPADAQAILLSALNDE